MSNTPDAPLEVTEENFGDLLIQGANEALAYIRGSGNARVHYTAAPPVIPPPPAYAAERIRALRLRFGFNQRSFARVLNVSDQTVRAWEQGINTPSGASLRLLELAERYPEVLRAAVGVDA